MFTYNNLPMLPADARALLSHPTCAFPGCIGVLWPSYDRCLAHLDPEQRRQALEQLSAGDSVDCRGVPFTEVLLEELKTAVGNTFGACLFVRASFHGVADFASVEFTGEANFWCARFTDDCLFDEAAFRADALFEEAVFELGASFEQAEFLGLTWFQDTLFGSDAAFSHAAFTHDAFFSRSQMFGEASFEYAAFTGEATFVSTTFEERATFYEVAFGQDAIFAGACFKADASFPGAEFTRRLVGPIFCGGQLDLSRTVLRAPMRLRIAAARLTLHAARIDAAIVLDVRYAGIHLLDAVLSQPVAVNFHPSPLTFDGTPLSEELLAGQDARPAILTLAGVDVALLALAGMDLSECRLSGAHHLDQLRFEGHVIFADPPAPVRIRLLHLPMWWWTRRRTIAEEHHWRALPLPGRSQTRTRGWQPGSTYPDPATTPGPKDVAAVYRQLRKALEDGKNEPGAADFYYGEMEMRRLDRDTPFGERVLLHTYWLVSGYGLRASRALAALAAAMFLTVVLTMLWGLPRPAPTQMATGTMPAPGNRIHLVINQSDPGLSGPLSQRWTAERAQSASRVVLNSVVFRSSDQDLTTAGTWIEMFSRFSEPLLLGLAALAARGRIKR